MKKNNRGFTMAELLIVVAIIAVLVAIAIPVFSTQLEKAREGTDLSNIRSMYAEAALVVLNGDAGTGEISSITGGAITATKDATTGKVTDVTIAGFEPSQQTAGWVIDVSDVAGQDISSYKPVKGTSAVSIKFTFDDKGELSAVAAG